MKNNSQQTVKTISAVLVVSAFLLIGTAIYNYSRTGEISYITLLTAGLNLFVFYLYRTSQLKL